MSTKVNLKVVQGGTFSKVLRWESPEKVYKHIAGILKTAPVEISTVEAHGVPEGWRVKISNVLGMKELNTETYYPVSKVLPGSFQINDINALGFNTYTSGGVVEYNKPVSLENITGRMQIRSKVTSEEVILELNVSNGGIIIDNNLKTIIILITAEQTASLDFVTAVYSLELMDGNVVIPFINGSISLTKEVTR